MREQAGLSIWYNIICWVVCYENIWDKKNAMSEKKGSILLIEGRKHSGKRLKTDQFCFFPHWFTKRHKLFTHFPHYKKSAVETTLKISRWTEYLYKWKYAYWIELNALWQMKKKPIMSYFSFLAGDHNSIPGQFSPNT